MKLTKSTSRSEGEPIVIFHGIGMSKYSGHESTIDAGSFKFAQEHGYGHELFNFRPIKGRNYGFVQIQTRLRGDGLHSEPRLDLTKLGGAKGSEFVNGVTLVWTAPMPDSAGRTVVGWYRNAKVFRSDQVPDARILPHRTFRNEAITFRASAATEDCTLVPREKRRLVLPPKTKGQKGIPGQFSVFYPPRGSAVEAAVLNFISDFESGFSAPPHVETRKAALSFQLDVERRFLIETTAIQVVWKSLADLRYSVESVERDKIGFDLKATRGSETLCVEVKGRSGADVVADFTFREFAAIKEQQKGKYAGGIYRICIVTDTLKEPRLYHFQCLLNGEWWTIDRAHRLIVNPVEAGRGVLS